MSADILKPVRDCVAAHHRKADRLRAVNAFRDHIEECTACDGDKLCDEGMTLIEGAIDETQ